jgi:gamma-carbonic anhydrase
MIRPHRGRLPRIPSSVFIDDSAQVIGDVEIGDESSVWMGVVIRGDVNWIRIGKRSNVQDGTIVHVMTKTHPTTIGDNVTIGHGAIVHGCTIEDQCLIGSPGKVKRTLTDAEVLDIQAYADRYVNLRLDYMNNAVD